MDIIHSPVSALILVISFLVGIIIFSIIRLAIEVYLERRRQRIDLEDLNKVGDVTDRRLHDKLKEFEALNRRYLQKKIRKKNYDFTEKEKEYLTKYSS